MKEMVRSGISFIVHNDIPTIVKEFNKRDTHPFLQFVKYGLCGVLAVIVHMTVFYLLAKFVLPALDSSIVNGEVISDSLRARNSTINNFFAWGLSNYVAYRINVLWVFEPGRHNRWVEFGLFTLVSFIAFVGGLVGGPLLIHFFGINTHVSQLLFVVTSACVNYLCRKFLIFKF